MSSYKLSLNSVRSINRTIVAVNQMRKTGIAGDLPFRQNQKRQPQTTGATLRIGKTKAGQAWAINTEATLDVWVRNADTGNMEKGTGEFTAYNLFADVAADKFVGCIGQYLVSAECD